MRAQIQDKASANQMKIRTIGTIATLLAFLFLALPNTVNAIGCGTLPAAQAPLTILCIPANTAASSASSAAQLMWSFNALNYSSFLASNLQNVYVYNSVGAYTTNAWIEGNVLNEQQTTNLNLVGQVNAGNVIIWVNDLAANIISTGSDNNYYIGIGALTTNFFVPGNGIGIALQLSGNNVNIDNSANVFLNSYNFAGTSCPSGIQCGGSPTISNAVTVAQSTPNQYALTSTAYGANPNIFYDILASSPSSCATSTNCQIGGASDTSLDNICGFGQADRCVTPTGALSAAGVANYQVYSTQYGASSSLFMINYYINTESLTTSISSSEFFGVATWTANSGTIVMQWLHRRLAPPNNIMPSTTFGGIHSPSSLLIAPNPVIYGTNSVVSFTCFPSSDTCTVDSPLGTHLCTGTGSCSFTANYINYGVGTYTFWGNDLTEGTNTLSQTLTVNQGPIIETLPNCGNQAYTSTGFSCTTTATCPSIFDQVQCNLYLNNALITNSIPETSNSASWTITNTIGNQNYVGNTLGNGNYLPNSLAIYWEGYVPITLKNATTSNAIIPTNTALTLASNTITGQTVPFQFFTNSPSNTIRYTISNAFAANVPGNTIGPVFNAINGNYISDVANIITGSWIYWVNETQYGNTITANVLFNPVNSVIITGPFTFNTLCSRTLQYFPNCVIFPFGTNTFTSKPTSWTLKSDYPGNQHKNFTGTSNNLEQWSNANLTYIVTGNLILTYGQFTPAITITATSAQNPLMTSSITQTLGCTSAFFAFGNTVPSAPCSREITNITNYDEQFKKLLFANTTIFATYGFNNYSISNTTSFSANNMQLYMGQSLYQNPTITQATPSIISAASGHFDAINTFCSQNINFGTYRNFNIYSVNTNGSLYTFTVFKGYNPVPPGTFMEVFGGISQASSIQVQNFKINSNPYSVPLQNGQPYAFKFVNCTSSIFETNFSVWGNPITLYLPNNFTGPVYQLPILNATCGEAPFGVNTLKIICNGTDLAAFTNAWKIKVYNVTTPLSSTLLNTSLLRGTSFTFTYKPVSPKAEYQVIIVADVGNVIDPQYTVLSYFTPQTLAFLPQVVANGWLALLMILSAIAIGSKSPAMSLLFEGVVLFLLPTMNILPIPVAVVYTSIALVAVGAFIMVKRYVYG